MSVSGENKITVEYRGTTFRLSIRYRQKNEESLLFIHGLGCSKDSFKDVWEFSEFNDYTILSFDLVGFGASSKPRSFSYTLEEHAEICKLVVEKLNIKQIHVVGHSMGGAIGLLLVEKIPSMILSFINLEGNLIGEDCTFSRATVSHALEEFEERIFAELQSTVRETKPLYMSERTRRLFYQWLVKSDPYAYYRSSESLVQWSDSGELLRMFTNMKTKRWYVCGEANRNHPVLKKLSNVQKMEISHSGHFMMTDNPEEFYHKLSHIIAGTHVMDNE
jgi:pimeloyl-ACP methyl ester carboxylesterase